MTTVMGKSLGGIVGLNLGHFLKFDGLEWCVPDICWSRCLLFGTLPQEELKTGIEVVYEIRFGHHKVKGKRKANV